MTVTTFEADLFVAENAPVNVPQQNEVRPSSFAQIFGKNYRKGQRPGGLIGLLMNKQWQLLTATDARTALSKLYNATTKRFEFPIDNNGFVCHALTTKQASELMGELIKLPNNGNKSYQPAAPSHAQPTNQRPASQSNQYDRGNDLRELLGMMTAMQQELADLRNGTSAPVPAAGHTISAPEFDVPDFSEFDSVPVSQITLRTGSVISVLDEQGNHHQFQIVSTQPGKFRLNKTVVAV